MGGQGDPPQLMPARQALLKSTALGLLAAFGLCAATQGAERQTPSGMAVPRYVSLKFDKVNARSGPGDDHKLLFVYKVRGLPLQVIAETSEWRRVCDPEGTLAWVHKRVTDGRRTTMNTTAAARGPPLKRPKGRGFRAGRLFELPIARSAGSLRQGVVQGEGRSMLPAEGARRRALGHDGHTRAVSLSLPIPVWLDLKFAQRLA